MSTAEPFALTVTEALWKGKPHSPAGAAYRIRYLLRYAEKRQRMGATGHDFVREHFLLTRQLRDYLTMLLRVGQRSSAPAA
jgi:trehalose synthase